MFLTPPPSSATAHQTPDRADERSAGPLQAPGCTRPKQRPHQDAQVVPRHLHQVPLGHIYQPTQPTPPRPAALADMGKAALHILTPQPLQALPPGAPHPAAVVAVGPLPALRLVRPHTPLR